MSENQLTVPFSRQLHREQASHQRTAPIQPASEPTGLTIVPTPRQPLVCFDGKPQTITRPVSLIGISWWKLIVDAERWIGANWASLLSLATLDWLVSLGSAPPEPDLDRNSWQLVTGGSRFAPVNSIMSQPTSEKNHHSMATSRAC